MSEIDENMQTEQADYQNIDITDDFMFAYVMQRPDLWVELLKYLFPGHKIQKIKYLSADEKSGLYRYTFRNKCDEADSLELGDELYKVFFSTVGKGVVC